jgi:hypothetical protein
VNFGAIEGLSKALADPSSGVSSIYSYQTCDKAWQDIDALRAGRAIFTQPQGVIKCAGGQYSPRPPPVPWRPLTFFSFSFRPGMRSSAAKGHVDGLGSVSQDRSSGSD